MTNEEKNAVQFVRFIGLRLDDPKVFRTCDAAAMGDAGALALCLKAMKQCDAIVGSIFPAEPVTVSDLSEAVKETL